MTSMTPYSLLRHATVLAVAAIVVVACSESTQDNFTNPPPGPPATCSVGPVAGCSSNAQGYNCSTSDRPDDPDGGALNLVCSKGVEIAADEAGTEAGATYDFCCIPYEQAATLCTPNPTLPGCDAPSVGFSCTGPTSPDEADSALTCTPGPVTGGTSTFCCLAH